MPSPTARTLKALRDHGWTAQVVERWNMHARIRQDLFGFIDIVAMGGPFEDLVGVQATVSGAVANRIDKITALETPAKWLRSRGRIIVVGWRKVGKAGKRKTWQPRIIELVNGGEAHDWLPVEIEHPDFHLEGHAVQEEEAFG